MPPRVKPVTGRKPPARPERVAAFKLGLSAESRAAMLLLAKGYRIAARRWRTPVGEIDIVARRRRELVFVEVKARAEGALVSGYHAVDERKKRALRRAVHAYLAGLTPPPRTFRFDVAEVTLSGRLPAQVMHYDNVPLFPKGYYVARQSNSLDEVAGGQ